jgi:hypothetical protein
MATATRIAAPRSSRSAGSSRRTARVEVPFGLSSEEARRVLAAVASGAGAVVRTGRTLTLDIEPAPRKGPSRFRVVKRLRAEALAPRAEAEPKAEIPAGEARAALRRAYARGEEAAAELLSGPEMLSSDEIAGSLGLSREAVHRKRRRGELLGIEGAKRGVRFPAWQLGPDGPACRCPRCGPCTRPWAVPGPCSASSASATPNSACAPAWRPPPTRGARRMRWRSPAASAPSARPGRDGPAGPRPFAPPSVAYDLRAIVREGRADAVGHGGDEGVEEVGGDAV